jgi:DNA end-binding protein Ku
LKQVVEAKIAGKEIVAPPVSEQVQVLNLMDALKKSVAQAQAEEKPAKPAEGERPPKKVAPSTPGQAEVKTRKRRTS